MRRVVTGKTVLRIKEGGAAREARFPELLRAEGFDASWQDSAEFESTLTRRDRELGRLLRSPTFSALITDKVGPYAFPLGLCAALVALGFWILGRVWRRWPAYLIGTPFFLLVLFGFFVQVEKLLPAGY